MKSFLLVAYYLVITYAEDNDIFAMEKRAGRKHYCGAELRRNLMFLCESIYKRSAPDSGSLREDWMMSYMGAEEPETPNHYPFRSRTKALAMFPVYFRRQTRGVADECCANACTISELATYCGPRS